jgi:lipopolysaccharide/colanic/teichoic acid biosynthesis glycosyltransferase
MNDIAINLQKNKVTNFKTFISLSFIQQRIYGFFVDGFEILITIFCILLLAPLILVISIGIIVIDDGPIFYKQQRIGKNGLVFWIYKFRTMVPDAEKIFPNYHMIRIHV